MKRVLISLVVACLMLAASAMAANSKFSAVVTQTLITNGASGTGHFNMDIHTSNKTDLIVGVSLQSTVLTETKTKGRNGETNLSVAEGKVNVCLSVDDGAFTDFDPDCVVFEMRKQTLETKLGGIVTCPTVDIIGVDDFCAITGDEEVNLLLETMSANHFNFVVRDLSAGDHAIKVTVFGTTNTSCTTTDESCRAEVAVGPGSITIEEVKGTNDGTSIIFN